MIKSATTKSEVYKELHIVVRTEKYSTDRLRCGTYKVAVRSNGILEDVATTALLLLQSVVYFDDLGELTFHIVDPITGLVVSLSGNEVSGGAGRNYQIVRILDLASSRTFPHTTFSLNS